ncbi:MAG: Rne/Rng family ribonuclease [Proteobacteria bacterium]|nr:Rne/Rng family ribonuclease [Pseudomonadota bacterium]
MTKRMLIDGSHPEEIRVVITDGNRLDEYDIETSTKTQLKGNIYLAKVTRVEPSLQAAFVDYGGGRHGFLAFSEIHPDYYQIPIEDREALKRDLAQLEGKAQAAQAHIDEIDGEVPETDTDDDEAGGSENRDADGEASEDNAETGVNVAGETDEHSAGATDSNPVGEIDSNPDGDTDETSIVDAGTDISDADTPSEPVDAAALGAQPQGQQSEESEAAAPSGGDEAAEEGAPPKKGYERRGNPTRRYKIQEVIKRRQILLIQVVKEERGNKGAALTTYLSLAGRYCVLMPNATRSGGGVSRKITSTADRRRLRDLLKDLNVSEGMGVIMRTAGMERNKSEIKRDFDYLMRLWEDVRALTLESAAPALVYEEGDLIKRAIRDLYARDIEEVAVEGTEAYQAAKKLMRMMMPSHAKRVQPYRDDIPLFHRYQVETQLESMHNPVVQLKSGGYIVIDTTEALVAIDVNSGRSTKERNIEETAAKTNLEAAAEIGRQLRLRDLAGLIVIDFIDMEESRNQRAVEKRMTEAVKIDRARIQLGRISTFGLFELSRQRLRPSIIETSTDSCPHCHGAGFVRSIESTALHALRMIEEEGIRIRSSDVAVAVPTSIALYLLNQKRDSLITIENRYGFKVSVTGDDTLIPPDMRIERTKSKTADRITDRVVDPVLEEPFVDDDDDIAEEDEVSTEAAVETEKESAHKRRPRRRRKKEPGTGEATSATLSPDATRDDDGTSDAAPDAPTEQSTAEDPESAGERPAKRRRRGRRGGKRRGQRSDSNNELNGSEESPVESVSNGINGNGSEAELSPRGEDTLTKISRPPMPAPTAPPAEIEANPSVEDAVVRSSADQPRRGWWQRLIE